MGGDYQVPCYPEFLTNRGNCRKAVAAILRHLQMGDRQRREPSET
jgi:hypothetical protein